MGRGGYSGGSSIIRIGRGGTSWGSRSDSTDVRRTVLSRQKKKSVGNITPTVPQYAPHGSERQFLTKLAKAKARRERLPKQIPKKLRTSIEQAGGILAWVNNIPDRKELFLQLFNKERELLNTRTSQQEAAQKQREASEEAFLRALAKSSNDGSLSQEIPRPFKKLRGYIKKCGGNVAWLQQDKNRLAYFHRQGGNILNTVADKCLEVPLVQGGTKPHKTKIHDAKISPSGRSSSVLMENCITPKPREVSASVEKAMKQLSQATSKISGIKFTLKRVDDCQSSWLIVAEIES